LLVAGLYEEEEGRLAASEVHFDRRVGDPAVLELSHGVGDVALDVTASSARCGPARACEFDPDDTCH
jgi:hypothetical protein